MHYTIRYNSAPEKQLETDAIAIRDVQEYLGRDKYCELFGQHLFLDMAKDAPYSFKKSWVQYINLACAMTGIRGRPVKALKRALFSRYHTDRA